MLVFQTETFLWKSFIDFIHFVHAHEKAGSGLVSEILKKLAEDGTDIENARDRSYDKIADVADNCNGVQADIL